VGLLPSGVTNHLKAIHGLTLRLAQREVVEVICTQECVARETSDVALTLSVSFALPGLQVEPGHCCNSCPYATKELRTLSNHWYKSHSGPFNKDVYHQGFLQTFFMSNICYFEVVHASSSSLPEASLYQEYLAQIAPTLPTLERACSTADNDILPLLRVTNWNDYVKSITGPELTSDDLMTWVAVPTGQARQTWEGNVRAMVLNYMKKTHEIGKLSELDVRRILIAAPRYVMFAFCVFH